MLILVTGRIGSGKSTLAKALTQYIANECTAPVWAFSADDILTEWFSLDGNFMIIRELLRPFADATDMACLHAHAKVSDIKALVRKYVKTHPQLISQLEDESREFVTTRLLQCTQSGLNVVIEIPLLAKLVVTDPRFAHMVRHAHVVVCAAPHRTSIKRIMQRDDCDMQEAERRYNLTTSSEMTLNIISEAQRTAEHGQVTCTLVPTDNLDVSNLKDAREAVDLLNIIQQNVSPPPSQKMWSMPGDDAHDLYTPYVPEMLFHMALSEYREDHRKWHSELHLRSILRLTRHFQGSIDLDVATHQITAVYHDVVYELVQQTTQQNEFRSVQRFLADVQLYGAKNWLGMTPGRQRLIESIILDAGTTDNAYQLSIFRMMDFSPFFAPRTALLEYERLIRAEYTSEHSVYTVQQYLQGRLQFLDQLYKANIPNVGHPQVVLDPLFIPTGFVAPFEFESEPPSGATTRDVILSNIQHLQALLGTELATMRSAEKQS